MEPLVLYTSTGNQQVDNILHGTIGILETTFSGRIKAYYLHGSFVDGSAIETSDIDLFLVSRGKFTAEEREQIQRIMHFGALFSLFMVEMIAVDEDNILQNGHFRIKAASQLLWGEDLRASVPEQTLDQYLALYARFPFIYITAMIRNTETVTSPLTYPQPDGEFYGYDQQLLPPANVEQHNVKKLVTSVCWIATILIAWQAGKTVPGKKASVEMYREYINDEWTTFIEEVYELGNRQWHYLIPQEPEDRQKLRNLCARALVFENYYLRKYMPTIL
jgi:Polymerase beta, Nucleotidyltransferase